MLKKLLFTISILFTFCLNNTIIAQTKKEIENIRSFYDAEKLKQLEQRFSRNYEENRAKAYQFAKDRGIKTSYVTKEGSYVELQGILPDGTLLYYTTFNVDAARSARTDHLNIGGSLGLDLDGQNMIAHVWDEGLARSTHQEYDGSGGNDRFSIGDGSSTLNFHSAHVTGTIIASGIDPAAKGMAPQAEAIGYDWNSDLSEATTAANNGMLLSNHSYGFISNQVPDYFFGGYISESRSWDELLYNAPYYLMVVAAGNDGNDNTSNGSPLAGNAAYDKLTGHSVSKNNLVVANAQDASVDAAGNLLSVTINNLSSEGPTDDFRIKPDITGNGTGVYSTYESSDTDYFTISGTSMASPNVAGSLLLLQQHANNLYGSFLRASTLKGLALHTADDIGPIGPDAVHGWGLLNAKKAAETLSNNSSSTVVEELVLDQGETFTIDVTASGLEALKASISWTDPAGIATTNLNDTTPVLVNDLDITVNQTSSTFFPWRLTGVDSNANDSDNIADNFERVDIQNPSGVYTITVTHKGTLTNNSQNFSLIVTGVSNAPQFCGIPGQPSATNITDTAAEINWAPSFSNPTNGYDYFVTSTGIIPDENTTGFNSTAPGVTTVVLNGLIPQTDYDVYIRSDCAGTPSFSDWVPVSFTTTCSATSLPYIEDFENGIDSCWSLSDPSQVSINANCGTNTTDFLRIRGGIHATTTIPINANGESSLGISFDIRNGCTETSDPNEPLNVEYWDGTAWILIESIESSAVSQIEWEQKNYDISSVFGFTSDFKLRFNRLGGTINFDDLNIDNLSIVSNVCSAVIPSNLIVTSITDTSAEINWDSQTAAIYDLRYRESGTSPWIDISDLVASSTNLTALTALTEYEVQVRSKCLEDIPTAYSSSIFFTTEDILPVYCDAGPTDNIDSEIENVILNGETTSINNNTTNICTGSLGGEISDFTNLSADLIPGSNYILSVEFGDCDGGTQFDGAGGVWIDWNLDGDFEDANEEVETVDANVSAGNVVVDFTIAVPLVTNVGNYRMRIVQEEGATAAEVSPCGTFTWGAVEDYTIIVNENPCTVFEDFEAGLPSGWATEVNSGTCDWASQSATPTGDDFPTLAMVFDDDACGGGAPASNVSLLSDVYDTTGASSILINYDVAFQELGSGETLTVEVWDGATWQQIAFYDAGLNPDIQTEADIDATAFANSNFQVRWTYDDAAGAWGWHAGVDNFCMGLVFNNWEGTVNTDWNTPGNWSLGTVPTSTDSAVIQDVTNQPLIDDTTTAEVDDLILNANTVVSVEGILKVSGNIANDGDIVFKSSELSGSSQFDEFNGTISGTGEVTVERYFPAKRAFRLLASPVTTTDFIYENWQENGSTPATPDGLGTHVTGGEASLGFDQSGSNSPSMFTFDNTNANGGAQTDDWYPLSNTNDTRLQAGVPYLTMVRGDRTIDLTTSDSPATPTTLRAKGDLFTGSFSPVLSTTSEHYSLVANPYQAIVDFDDVTQTGLTGYIYVWDAAIDGANGRGGYVTVDLPSSGVAPPPASSSQASHYLAPGMSFFIQNDTDVNTTSTIFFQEPNKRTDVAEVGIFSTYPDFYINSRLYETSAYLNGDTESDAIGLRFSDDFTTPGDSEDATKLFNPGENYAIVNNGLRSIDKQQIPGIGHQIDLGILNYQETNYSLTFEMENKPAGLGVFILDNYLNTQTEIAASFVYDFSVDANIPQSVAEDRFSLVFDTTLSVDENTFGEGFRLYPNPVNNGQFSIRTPNLSGEVTVELVNMLGQKVMSKNLTIEGNEVNVNAGQLSDGVYIVKLVKDNKTFVTKLIVE